MTVEPIKREKEVKRMLKYFRKTSRRNFLLFRFGLNTILRIGDILRIKHKDIFTANGQFREYLTMGEQKTGKGKKIKLNEKIKKELKNYTKYFELEPDDYFFFSTKNPNEHLSRCQAWRVLKDGAEHCGVENFGTHSMRKTLAFRIYTETKNLALVQKMLNHSSPAYTLRYIGIDQELIDEAYDEFAI